MDLNKPARALSWDRPTPKVARMMPIHCLTLRSSLPRSQPANAVTTGIVDMNMLDFATPRCLIVFAHNEKAAPEQRIARQRIGFHTFQLR